MLFDIVSSSLGVGALYRSVSINLTWNGLRPYHLVSSLEELVCLVFGEYFLHGIVQQLNLDGELESRAADWCTDWKGGSA